jgi:hypothetical protein
LPCRVRVRDSGYRLEERGEWSYSITISCIDAKVCGPVQHISALQSKFDSELLSNRNSLDQRQIDGVVVRSSKAIPSQPDWPIRRKRIAIIVHAGQRVNREARSGDEESIELKAKRQFQNSLSRKAMPLVVVTGTTFVS